MGATLFLSDVATLFKVSSVRSRPLKGCFLRFAIEGHSLDALLHILGNRYKRSCKVASLVSYSKSGGLLERPTASNRGEVLSPLRYRRAFTGCPSSHGELQADFYGPGRDAVVEVGDAPHIVDADELEDVLDADAVLHVGGAGEEAYVFGQQVEACLAVGGVVHVGHAAVEDVEAYHLAQAQPFDEGEVVEDEPFHVVGGEERHVAVGHEPVHAQVDVAEGGEPDAVEDVECGAVVVESVEQTHFVAQGDGGGVGGEVEEGAFACAATAHQRVGREGEACGPLGIDDVLHTLGAVWGDAAVAEQAGGLDVLGAYPGVDADEVGPLFAQPQLEVGNVLRGHLFVGPHEQVVAVVLVEREAGRLDVVAGVEADVAQGVLLGETAFVGKGVDEVQVEFETLVFESVGCVAVDEVARVEACGGHAAHTEAKALGAVVADEVVDGAEIESAGVA